jgi:glycosyltransferase involved in cell wall biosynthesis
MEQRLASVIVPAFNEGPALSVNVAALLEFLACSEGAYQYEVIVIDDGSSDETYAAALECMQMYAHLRVVRHGVNRGLGATLRTGFAFAEGMVLIPFDSDLSYGVSIVPELLSELERWRADLVLASPYMRGGRVVNVPFLRRFLSREANRFLSFATNGKYATATCMVRAYRAEFFKDLKISEDRMEVNPELLFKAIRAGAVIREVPARLEWSKQRATAARPVSAGRTLKQVGRTLQYGIAHRPAVLLALPGILPGVLPLVVAALFFFHASLKTIAIVTLCTMVIQNASLVLFAGQLAVFGRNVLRRPSPP